MSQDIYFPKMVSSDKCRLRRVYSLLISLETPNDVQSVSYQSDFAHAQAGLSLCLSPIPHCWKSHVAAQIIFVKHYNPNHMYIRYLFHVYLNRLEFHFLQLHINKTNKFCFFMHNGRVPDIAK